ncbi:hypothetical protein Hanom_Chr15g01378371 [Helianthus anomalus]
MMMVLMMMLWCRWRHVGGPTTAEAAGATPGTIAVVVKIQCKSVIGQCSGLGFGSGFHSCLGSAWVMTESTQLVFGEVHSTQRSTGQHGSNPVNKSNQSTSQVDWSTPVNWGLGFGQR